MKTITGAEGTQGTPEWIALRLSHFTASEAAAMLGLCKYKTRTQLLDEKKSGIAPAVTEFQQKLFDKGHATEAAMLPIAEGIIGEELYPVVGSLEVEGLPLLASFDGLTMDETSIYEHKLWNDALAEWVRSDQVPDSHWPQLEQQLLVAGAERVLFVVSDGTENKMQETVYESVPQRRQRLIDGWKQFARDLESHEATAPQQAPVAAHVDSLPALFVEVTGMVTDSNLAEYKAKALDFISSINTELQTDQDFADADAAVKFLDKAEKSLEAAKHQALSKTASIEELFRTLDDLRSEMRTKRLKLNKQVNDQKQAIKRQIASESNAKLKKLIEELNASLAPYSIPDVPAFPAEAMKGKSNINSIRDAVDTDRAKSEQEAHQIAAHVAASAKIIGEQTAGYETLFPDRNLIARFTHQGLRDTIKARIAEHNESMRQAEERAVAKAKADSEAIERTKAMAEAARAEGEAASKRKISEEKEIKGEEKPQAFQQPEHKESAKFQQPEKLSEYDAGYLDGLRAGLAATNKTYEQLQAEYLRSAA